MKLMHRAARGVKRNYRSFTKLSRSRYPDIQRRFQPLTDSLTKPKVWATTAFLAVITLIAVNIATQSQEREGWAATGFSTTIEAESGTINNPATIVDDISASRGKAIQFGAIPQGSGSCPVATPNMPDGPDPFGGCFPGPETTGIPAGTTLSAYTGPCTITTNNTTIDSKTVNCNLQIQASNVTIKNSQINGRIVNENCTSFSYAISDSRIYTDNINFRGLNTCNYTATRVNVSGGQSMAWCGTNCTIKDSYLHNPLEDPEGAAANQAAHNSTVRIAGSGAKLLHNTLWCEVKEYPQPNGQDTSGCSANQTGYSHDGSPPSNALIEGNLYMPTTGGFCAYGGSTTGALSSVRDIVFKDNVFKRGTRKSDKGTYICGYYGAITSFDASRPGNQWINNKWDDGTALNP